MYFLRSDILAPIVIIALFLGLLLARAQQLRNTALKNLRLSSIKQHSTILSFIVICILALSLSMPYRDFEEFEIPGIGTDIVVIVDISRSMLAKDTPPSRLEIAKRKIYDLLKILEERGSNDRLAIVLFAGQSYLFAPLTQDFGVLRYFTNSISDSLINAQGSNLNSAIETTIKSLKEVGSLKAKLILLSDGEDSSLDAARSIAQLKAANLSLNAIGIGSANGAPIEKGRGQFIQDHQGNIVISKLEAAALSKLCTESGGIYRNFELGDGDLQSIIADSNSLEKENNKSNQKIRSYNHLAPYLLWLALLIIFCAKFFQQDRVLFSVLFFLTYTLDSNTAYCQDKNSLHDAYKFYEKGAYDKALPTFEREQAKNKGDQRILQALGSTLFKLGRYKEAAQKFSESLALAKTPHAQFEGLYNFGNALLADKQYSQAISAFDQALKIKSDDKAANFNLALAKKLLEQQQKQEQEHKEKQQEDSQDEQKQQQNSGSNSPDSSSKQKQSEKNPEQENQDQNQQDNSSQHKDKQDQATPAADKQVTNSAQEGSADKQKQQSKPDPKLLSQREAKNWLDSLSDNQILLRRSVNPSQYDDAQEW